MLDFFRLNKFLPATFILLTAKVACSQSVSASSKYPVAPNSNSVPICYVQKADGTNLGLSNLCRKVTEPTTLAEQSGEAEPTTLAEQSEDEAEPTTLAEQKEYEAELNALMSRRRKLPDTDTLINALCNLHGQCALQRDSINVSTIDESP